MRYLTRTSVICATLMLAWMNVPVHAEYPAKQQTLWQAMSNNFTIPNDRNHADVQRQIDTDLQDPGYIHKLTKNARPYLYYVYQQTQEKHLPAELALLPMIESNYMPYGTSRTGATGLWQLMPHTARNYGISMNMFYDGRRSVTVSTNAALTFLTYLYNLFGHNWLLAIAAYNAGPGTVMAAIHYNQAHHQPTDFWALPLPNETRAYIPKLLAISAIIEHAPAYGVHLAPIPNAPVAKSVMINKEISVTNIAHLAHTPVKTIKQLNPALTRAVTPPHQTIALMLPINKTHTFEKHLATQTKVDAALRAQKLAKYKVQSGESLGSIAHKFHMTLDTLKSLNQMDNNLIHVGETLLIPIRAHEASKILATAKKPTNTAASYKVKPGDTLVKIGMRYHMTADALMEKNHLHSAVLHAGQTLLV